MAIEQWEIYQADLDPTRGHEQRGERPVLILSSEPFNRRSIMVIVAPLTTLKPGRKLYPAEAFIPAGAAGQPEGSLVLIHQMRSLDLTRLGKRYGRLTDPDLRTQVSKALDFALGDAFQ
jgi:mRNA interferase MazF